METTQGHQIFQTGLTAVRPVHNVMSIHISRFATPGKAAGFIPQCQRSLYEGGNRSGAAADIEYIALLIFQRCHQAGVAG